MQIMAVARFYFYFCNEIILWDNKTAPTRNAMQSVFSEILHVMFKECFIFCVGL